MDGLRALSKDVQDVIHRIVHRDKLQSVHREFKEKTCYLLIGLFNMKDHPEGEEFRVRFCKKCKGFFADKPRNHNFCSLCWMDYFMLPHEHIAKWVEVFPPIN